MPPPLPTVSVVLSVHDDIRYLEPALLSLLGQSFPDFEIILVDDGSRHQAVLEGLAARDPRIRLLRNDRNLGLTLSLNRAISQARAPLIARMDADDLCMANRFARQVTALRDNPSLGLLGTQIQIIDTDGKSLSRVELPCDDAGIRWSVHFFNPISHPAVMFRTSLFHQAGGYDPGFQQAQDYDLWQRMLRHCRAANLDHVLVKYRIHADAISARQREQQELAADRIKTRAWFEAGLSLPGSAEQRGALWALQAGVPPQGPALQAGNLAFLLPLLSSLSAQNDEGRVLAGSIARRLLLAMLIGDTPQSELRSWPGLASLLGLADWKELPGLREAALHWARRGTDFQCATVATIPFGFAACTWGELARYSAVWIYGAGSGGRRVAVLLKRLGLCAVAGFVDGHASGSHLGLPLINREQLPDTLAAGEAVLVAATAWRDIVRGLPAGLPVHIVMVDGDWRLLKREEERILA